MSPTAGTTSTDSSKYAVDFEAIAKMFFDQTKASLKQSEELFTVARKQVLSNIKNAEDFAIQTIEKVRTLTAESIPAMPEWVSTKALGDTVAAGFEVAEHVLAAERKVAASLVESMTVGS